MLLQQRWIVITSLLLILITIQWNKDDQLCGYAAAAAAQSPAISDQKHHIIEILSKSIKDRRVLESRARAFDIVYMSSASMTSIGLGIGFLLQTPIYNTVINLNTAFNKQSYFSIYAPHLLLIIGSGIVALPIILGVFGILRRRWRFLMIALALLSLYMALLSGACASGFAYFDQLKVNLQNDYTTYPTNPVWDSVRSTYGCVTNCVPTLDEAMHASKQRIGIISAVFLLVPLLTSITIIFHMRRDILYFK
ncbi:unnamed protein product [Adineta steineri]|uniref:Uncharacterized protein n=1 Tax=Adineta steineri TaxID=433720 RepID=A0A813MSN7_9BILA|nr:unnamed protein product [Adineta steineri]CAF0909786.1 unnamed protein product [Adineta steineri]